MGHIPHLYLPDPWEGSTIPLPESHLHHLRRVLRIRDGDPLSYTNGAGRVGSGNLEGDSLARGEESLVSRPSDLTVAVAPPGSRDRSRFLVEKLAELGIARLLWIRTRRAEGRPPSPDKTAAWAAGALEQSRGAWLMEIGAGSLEDLDVARLVVADPKGGEAPGGEGLVLLVGPEGGFDDGEIPDGATRMTLGSTILRVETAAIIGAALLGPRGTRPG